MTPDDDVTEWLEECASTDYAQTHTALPDWITEEDIEAAGYVKFNGDFENGFYGTEDNPTKIYQHIEEGVDDLESVIFQITSSEQFRTNFTAYYKLNN